MGWNMVTEGVVEHDGFICIGEEYRLKSRDQWINPIGEWTVPARMMRVPSSIDCAPSRRMREGTVVDIEAGGIEIRWTLDWRDGMREETTFTAWVNPENISLKI